MSKTQSVFVCENCGEEHPKWTGQCQNCKQWNTLKQLTVQPRSQKSTRSNQIEAPKSLSKIEAANVFKTHIDEFDRVLDGGITAGSVTLLTGEPGIGKSTLLLQIAAGINRDVLYVSAEESIEQINQRAQRLSINTKNILFSSTNEVESLREMIQKNKPVLAIIDSLQTIYSDRIEGSSGSPSQMRECALLLQELAKKNQIALVIVGHITKEGIAAGPKLVEHIVDTVLYLEGERLHGLRILRTTKNRFGATGEVGLFSMTKQGLIAVKDPTAAYANQEHGKVSGACLSIVSGGTRPLIVEIQALTSKTNFQNPKRVAQGINVNRMQLILAVLARRAHLISSDLDVYVKVAGGLTIDDPGADLGIGLALASSILDIPLGNTAAIGEVGLLGEVRPIFGIEQRIAELKKLGIEDIYIPNSASMNQNVPAKCIQTAYIHEVINKIRKKK